MNLIIIIILLSVTAISLFYYLQTEKEKIDRYECINNTCVVYENGKYIRKSECLSNCSRRI